MLQNDLDVVLHLGDYTYEYPIDSNNRNVSVPLPFRSACEDLHTYRMRHTLYKLDPDLQGAHQKFPFAVIWDDHEVANDYSGLAPEWAEPSPEFTAKRAAAYQAYYEHMPIRLFVAQRPKRGLRIYRRLQFGKLAEFSMLDDRQYRTDNPCGDGEALRCEAAETGRYTMLGYEQEQWLEQGFAESRARWNIIGQQLLIAELEHANIAENLYWNDAWDGYPRARTRLLNAVVDTDLRNPVFLTGDWHSTFVNDLKLDFKKPQGFSDADAYAARPPLRDERGESGRRGIHRKVVYRRRWSPGRVGGLIRRTCIGLAAGVRFVQQAPDPGCRLTLFQWPTSPKNASARCVTSTRVRPDGPTRL